MLGGALAAGHRSRVYDAVILKTLGATRARLLAAYPMEYRLIGIATAVFGALAGVVAAWWVLTRHAARLHMAGRQCRRRVAAALIVTVLLGLIGTWLVLNQKPAPIYGTCKCNSPSECSHSRSYT